jgi:uncharacterized membrane protein
LDLNEVLTEMAKKPSNMPIHTDGKHSTFDKEHLGLERLVFFSDAVFAISMTLLALEIRLPPAEGLMTSAGLLKILLSLWPRYLGYVISFLVVGTFWISHHRRFRFIERYDNTVLLLNVLLLMLIAFTPFPASVISEYSTNLTANIFYALTMALTSLVSGAIWWYAAHNNRLIDSHLPARVRRRETWSSLLVTAIFVVSIGLALINDRFAQMSWALAAVARWFIR